MLLKGKVCLVVGVSSLRGIGYATAELFASHGAEVITANISVDDASAARVSASIEQAVGRPVTIDLHRCDITQLADCQAVIERIDRRHGKLDCLVNAVGVVASPGVLDITGADFDRMINVNLKGAFNINQSALRLFTRDGAGSIVNIASVAAQRGGGMVGGAHYAASKGGLISLTRTIAREFGPQGIRANIVSPSMTDTGMLDETVTPERYAEVVSTIPLRRAGRPSDVAGACLYLASDLSAYVTGATIDVNGGGHIH